MNSNATTSKTHLEGRSTKICFWREQEEPKNKMEVSVREVDGNQKTLWSSICFLTWLLSSFIYTCQFHLMGKSGEKKSTREFVSYFSTIQCIKYTELIWSTQEMKIDKWNPSL